MHWNLPRIFRLKPSWILLARLFAPTLAANIFWPTYAENLGRKVPYSSNICPPNIYCLFIMDSFGSIYSPKKCVLIYLCILLPISGNIPHPFLFTWCVVRLDDSKDGNCLPNTASGRYPQFFIYFYIPLVVSGNIPPPLCRCVVCSNIILKIGIILPNIPYWRGFSRICRDPWVG